MRAPQGMAYEVQCLRTQQGLGSPYRFHHVAVILYAFTPC